MSTNPLRHVAIIMDGNNRWARQRGLPGAAGHKAGVERIRDAMRACKKLGVEVLTVFAFSSENWQRPPKEVEALMSLFHLYLQHEAKKLRDEGVRLKVIGRRDRFSSKICNAIEAAEKLTEAGTTTLVIAADYGGQWDIANAARLIAEKVRDGELDAQDVTDETLSQFIQLADFPALDLLIRTGGEIRISNFLLWQSAYTELFFSELYWPDFGEQALCEAADTFFQRQRRFGKSGDQIEEAARA